MSIGYKFVQTNADHLIPIQSRQGFSSSSLKSTDGIKSDNAKKPCWPFMHLHRHTIAVTQAIARGLHENPFLLLSFLLFLFLLLRAQRLYPFQLRINVTSAET